MGYPKDLTDWQEELSRWSADHGWHDKRIAKFGQQMAEYRRRKHEHKRPPELEELTVLAISSKIALIHSEASEALEALREKIIEPIQVDGKPEGVGIELADVIIRCINLIDQLGLSVDTLMRAKMAYNHTRPFKHGGKAI